MHFPVHGPQSPVTMEAFTAVTGCASLIDYITRTLCSTVSVLDTASSGRSELESVIQQMEPLKSILKAITDDCDFQDLSSDGERERLHDLTKKCLETLEDIHFLVDKHKSIYGSAYWACYGKTKLQSLRQSLYHNVEQLNLFLQKTASSGIRDVAAQTRVLGLASGEIRRDTCMIREDVASLKAQSFEQGALILRELAELKANFKSETAHQLHSPYNHIPTSWDKNTVTPRHSGYYSWRESQDEPEQLDKSQSERTASYQVASDDDQPSNEEPMSSSLSQEAPSYQFTAFTAHHSRIFQSATTVNVKTQDDIRNQWKEAVQASLEQSRALSPPWAKPVDKPPGPSTDDIRKEFMRQVHSKVQDSGSGRGTLNKRGLDISGEKPSRSRQEIANQFKLQVLSTLNGLCPSVEFKSKKLLVKENS